MPFNKSIVDHDLQFTVEVFDKDTATFVRIVNGQTNIVLTIQQFQRLMAFGDMLLHPKY